MHFRCEICNYSSNLKNNYNRHLTSNKHKKKILLQKETITIKSKTNILTAKDCEMTAKNAKTNTFDCEKTAKDCEMTAKTIFTNNQIKYECPYCFMDFTRKNNLSIHINRNCKVKNNSVDYKYLYEMEKKDKEEKIKSFQREKDSLYNQIEKLLEKVGNTNNFTQNIVLNNYGNEDLTHITKSFKHNLLKGPYKMIPKLIEAVHFSKKCPQNKNICLPNKNKPYLKIFHDGIWKYKDKKEGIQELIDINYTRLDNEYTDGDIEFDKDQNKRYMVFKSQVDDDNLLKKIEKDIELVLLNQEKL